MKAQLPAHQPAAAHLDRWLPCCSSSTSGGGAGRCRSSRVGLWALVAVVAGAIYPAFVQRFQVQPAESDEGAAVHRRATSTATRAAIGLDDVELEPGTIRSARSSDGRPRRPNSRHRAEHPRLGSTRACCGKTFQQLQELTRLLPDQRRRRRPLRRSTASRTQVVLAVRELNTGDVPVTTWEGRHLAYTHGYGVVAGPGQRQGPRRRRARLPRPGRADAQRPRPSSTPAGGLLRRGPRPATSVVGTEAARSSTTRTTATTQYAATRATDGVKLELARAPGRVRAALRRRQPARSRASITRTARRSSTSATSSERVQTLAPFLDFDADPYPVIIDGQHRSG